MLTQWFIRLPFAAVFAGHGAGKLLMSAASAEILALPEILFVLYGVLDDVLVSALLLH